MNIVVFLDYMRRVDTVCIAEIIGALLGACNKVRENKYLFIDWLILDFVIDGYTLWDGGRAQA